MIFALKQIDLIEESIVKIRPSLIELPIIVYLS
jgi:hypothetical protein